LTETRSATAYDRQPSGPRRSSPSGRARRRCRCGDLVERAVQDDRTPCITLDLEKVIRSVTIEPVGLRLADSAGELVRDARESAEAQVRELEAELALRRR
jgi:hypothetical protein